MLKKEKIRVMVLSGGGVCVGGGTLVKIVKEQPT